MWRFDNAVPSGDGTTGFALDYPAPDAPETTAVCAGRLSCLGTAVPVTTLPEACQTMGRYHAEKSSLAQWFCRGPPSLTIIRIRSQRIAVVPRPSFFRSLFSSVCKTDPAQPLLQHVRKSSVRRLVAIGMGDGDRTARLLELMSKQKSTSEIRFTGIDLFEGRDDATTGMTLKAAHAKLSGVCNAVRLVPGNPGSALKRCANELRGTDLVLVANDQDQSSLAASWHFLPRMLHRDSQVWMEQADGTFEILGPADVRARMAPRRAAA